MRKNNKLAIIFLIFTFMIFASLNTQAYEITAKSFGLGGAYTGLADDTTAILYNPAGLSDSGFLGVQFDLGMGSFNINKINEVRKKYKYYENEFDVDTIKNAEELFEDFPVVDLKNQLFLGGNFTSFAVGLNLNNKFVTKKTSPDILNAANTTNSTGILNWSNKLDSDFKNILGLAYGLNIKLQRTDYTDIRLNKAHSTNTIIKASGNGVGIDFGVMINLTKKIKTGVSFKNIIASDYKLEGNKKQYSFDYIKGEWDKISSESYTGSYTPEKILRFGASLDVPIINITVLGDIEKNIKSEQTITHLGLEKRILFNGLSIRGGVFTPSDERPTYTVGLGYNLAAFHLDMALGSNDKFNNNLTGGLSFNFQF